VLQALARFFLWNDYQRALVNPDDYEKGVPAAAIKEEIGKFKDYETRELMGSSLDSATDQYGNVTLKKVVDQLFSIDDRMRWELDNSMREFGRGARLGASFLADHLLARANKLAEGIHSGAKEKLGDALG
jgi:hypothetical protein